MTACQCTSSFYKNNKKINTSYFKNHIIGWYWHYYFHDSRLIWYSSLKSLIREFSEDSASVHFCGGILAVDCLNLLLKPKWNRSVQHSYDTDIFLCIIWVLELAYSSLLSIKAVQIAEFMGKKYTQSLFINLFWPDYCYSFALWP